MHERLERFGATMALLLSVIFVGLNAHTQAIAADESSPAGNGVQASSAASGKAPTGMQTELPDRAAFSRSLSSKSDAWSYSKGGLTVLHWTGQDCYVPGQFYSTVDQAHSKIIESLNTPELLPLRSYVDAYFQQLDSIMPPVIQISQSISTSVPGVPKAQADGILQDVRALFEKLSHLDPLAIDLSISSQPKGADFAIQVSENAQTNRAVNTNDQIPRVWRGLYTATIKMTGYKTGTFQLDLVDDSRSSLACTLIRSDQPGDTTCGRVPQ